MLVDVNQNKSDVYQRRFCFCQMIRSYFFFPLLVLSALAFSVFAALTPPPF
jgi:hypothetical protein